MVLLPEALILSAAIARIIRGHRCRAALISFTAPVLALMAFATKLVGGGAESCQSSTNRSSVCQCWPMQSA